MSDKIKNIAGWIWQLPQNICGIVWRNIKKDSIITEVGNSIAESVNAKVYLMRAGGGVTLGKYIFIGQTYQDQGEVRQRHTHQPLWQYMNLYRAPISHSETKALKMNSMLHQAAYSRYRWQMRRAT